jgi:cold shock CspA family protein
MASVKMGAFLRYSGWRLTQPARGQAVQFDVTKGPKGWQAKNVQAV